MTFGSAEEDVLVPRPSLKLDALSLEARERVLELLATSAPQRVMVDENLPAGTWIVVRAPEMRKPRPPAPAAVQERRARRHENSNT